MELRDFSDVETPDFLQDDEVEEAGGDGVRLAFVLIGGLAAVAFAVAIIFAGSPVFGGDEVAQPGPPVARDIPQADLSAAPVDGFARFKDGKIYLEGSAATPELVEEAVQRAAAIIGIDNVVNNMTIDPRVQGETDGRVVIDDAATFASGSAELRPQVEALAELALDVLERNPEVGLHINGHTDSVGSDAYNLDLSERRAAAVSAWLQERGIGGERITVTGLGASEPVADNESEEGRSRNRRIEFEFVGLF